MQTVGVFLSECPADAPGELNVEAIGASRGADNGSQSQRPLVISFDSSGYISCFHTDLAPLQPDSLLRRHQYRASAIKFRRHHHGTSEYGQSPPCQTPPRWRADLARLRRLQAEEAQGTVFHLHVLSPLTSASAMGKCQDAKTAQRMGEVGQAAHPTKQCGVDMAM